MDDFPRFSCTTPDCYSCDGAAEEQWCPSSQMECGHHCNHSWTHDICHWCGKEWGEEAAAA